MPLRYKEKIKVKRIEITKKIDPKIEMDLKDIDKAFPIPDKKISRPLDLSSIVNSIKHNFNVYIAPYITGEYKNIKKEKKEIIHDTKKTIKLRYQLLQLSEHLKDFIFQMRMYLISKAHNKEEYEKLEKEIKQWEEIAEKVIGDFLDNITFIIQKHLVPVCEKIEKEIIKEGVRVWKRTI